MQALYHAGGLRFREERVIHNGVRLEVKAEDVFRDRARLARPGELRLLLPAALPRSRVCTQRSRLALLDADLPEVSQGLLTILGDTQDAAYLQRLHGIINRPESSPRSMRSAVPEHALFCCSKTMTFTYSPRSTSRSR